MTVRAILAVALVVAGASRALAQTAVLPADAGGAPSGFLTRADWRFAFAGLASDDERFAQMARSDVDVDVASYPHGRVNFLFDVELVMGRERRAFDLNHENIAFETSASVRARGFEIAGLAHHVSRHLVDRPFDASVVAWHTVGVRAQQLFGGDRTRAAVAIDLQRVVQHTFVDYAWMTQATIRAAHDVGGDRRVYGVASGGIVGVDGRVPRGDQAGGRGEAGIHLPAQRAAVDLFGAWERRVDAYPLDRTPSTWVEFGARLTGR